MRRTASVLLGAALTLAAACRDDPRPSGRRALVDEAGVLDRAAAGRVVRYLDHVFDENAVDFRVVIAAPGIAVSPEPEARRWFEELDVGASTAGRGLLLWLDPDRRLARIEVGYALEGVVPDLSAAWIADAYLAPHARAEQTGAAVEAAVEGLIDRIRPRIEELAGSGATPGTGGGGARVDLARPIDSPKDPGDRSASLDLVPQPDPRATRDLELTMMRAGTYEPDAAIYDEEWRRTRARVRWSPERLREIAERFDRPYEVAVAGDVAVAYALDAADVGPTLLRREPEGWIIDATAGARLVVYDYSNASWYLIDEPSPYVELLRAVLELRRVRLESGRTAWMLAR